MELIRKLLIYLLDTIWYLNTLCFPVTKWLFSLSAVMCFFNWVIGDSTHSLWVAIASAVVVLASHLFIISYKPKKMERT